MRRAARGEIGKLSIGFGFHTFDLVPRVVAQLRRRAPEVQVKLRDMSTREQLVGLSSGTIDIGFVRLPVADDFEQLPVIQDSLAIVRWLKMPTLQTGKSLVAFSVKTPGLNAKAPRSVRRRRVVRTKASRRRPRGRRHRQRYFSQCVATRPLDRRV